MEDDNGLELSLGLNCGGSSAIPKGKVGSSSDTKTDEGDRGNKLIDDFKNFLHGGTQKQESGRSQTSDPVKPEENFFNNLSNTAVNVDTSSLNENRFWVSNENRSGETEEEKRSEAGSKRKNLFDEINNQKKCEKETNQTRTSHISITTDEGSTADNEDVADSEAEGSTSRLIPHHDDGSKKNNGGNGSYEAPKEAHGAPDLSGIDLQGQKMFTISSEKEFKFGNMSYGLPFPSQPVNIMNMPYSLPMSQPVMPANLPLMFGYSPVQIPVLDKDNSRGIISHSQQLHPAYFGRAPPNSDKQNDGQKISQAVMPVIPPKSSETPQYDGGRTSERPKSEGKQHSTEEGSSSQTEDKTVKAIGTSDQPRPEGFHSDYPAIRPGVAGDVKFGGCGSYPNLPWVSTTGPGPNGRTISGVTYRYSATQIRIVCACHGSHMSPDEFVQHAGEEQTNPDASSGLVSFPGSNSAASAQS